MKHRKPMKLPSTHPDTWSGEERLKYDQMERAFLVENVEDLKCAKPEILAFYREEFANNWRALRKLTNANTRFSKSIHWRERTKNADGEEVPDDEPVRRVSLDLSDEPDAPRSRRTRYLTQMRLAGALIVHPTLQSLDQVFGADVEHARCPAGCDPEGHRAFLKRFRARPWSWLHANTALSAPIIHEALSTFFGSYLVACPVPRSRRAPPKTSLPKAVWVAALSLRTRLQGVERIFLTPPARGPRTPLRGAFPADLNGLHDVRKLAITVALHLRGRLAHRWEAFYPGSIALSLDLINEDIQKLLYPEDDGSLPAQKGSDVDRRDHQRARRRPAAEAAATHVTEVVLGRKREVIQEYIKFATAARAASGIDQSL